MKEIKKLTYAEMTKVSTRLTREEMRQIMAGSGPGGGGDGNCNCIYCYDSSGSLIATICQQCLQEDPVYVCTTHYYYGNTKSATYGICDNCG